MINIETNFFNHAWYVLWRKKKARKGNKDCCEGVAILLDGQRRAH